MLYVIFFPFQYGALQFDKELRCIFNFFSSLSTFPFREKFARILQISKLLNLEKVSKMRRRSKKFWQSAEKFNPDDFVKML